jgi:hypothetical protein
MQTLQWPQNAKGGNQKSTTYKHYNGPKEKKEQGGQTMIYETLHGKQKTEQHVHHAYAPEGLSVSAPHGTPIVRLLNDTNVIYCGNRV